MKIISALVLVAVYFLTGCSSEEPKPQSQVAAPPAPTTTPPPPVANTPTPINPLDDPRSLLSKRSIYYDYNSSAIKNEYQSLIQAHGEYLAGHPDVKVRVEGNCDERGSAEYNLALSQRRADSVKAALKLAGAQGDQVETVGYGKERPKAEGHNETAWAENRRSDIVYLTSE